MRKLLSEPVGGRWFPPVKSSAPLFVLLLIKKNPVLISINAKLFSISFFKSHFFFFVFLVVFLNRTSSVVFSSSSF